MANKFKLAEAFTEFTIKGWTQFKARMMGAKTLALRLMAPFRALGGLIRKLFTPLGLGLGALGTGALIFKVLQLSSAATETKQAFDSIFGDSADDANAWVAQMAKAFRRNETNMRRALLRFQTIFRGFGLDTAGSFDVSKLALQAALDIEAFQNLPRGAAIDKVVSGITGMIRPLRDVGINVQQAAIDAELIALGFDKGAANASRLTKSLVALKIIASTIKTQGVIGQTGRELLGFAAQFRSMMDAFQTLGERAGDLLVPVFKELAFLASAISSVMGRVAKEILPTVVAFLAPLTNMLHTLARGIQNIDINTITADIGNIITKAMKLFRELFLLTIEAGGKLFVIWAKLAGEVFGEGLGNATKKAATSVLTAPFRLGRAIGEELSGFKPPGVKSRERLAAETTLGVFKEAGEAANKLVEAFSKDLLGGGGDAAAAKNAKDITEANIKAGSTLIESMLNALKGAGGAGAGGPSFFAVGFSALQKHLQSQVSKGESKQIELLQKGNDQRAIGNDLLQEGLDNPQPVPVGA
jgi:hypothetical protein